MEQILWKMGNGMSVLKFLYFGIVKGYSRLCQRYAFLRGKQEQTSIQKGKSLEKQAEQLLNEYGDSILRLAYTYLHNMADAEDILQETMIAYIQNKPGLVNGNHEKAWLLRVAANKSKNKIEYNRIRQTDELQEELLEQRRDDLSFVWDAVKQLPERYREAIHLFYYEGYSTREIARILGRKEGSIRSDLSRGRQMLKEILGEVYDFER